MIRPFRNRWLKVLPNHFLLLAVAVATVGRPVVLAAQTGSVERYPIGAVLAGNVVLGAAIAAIGQLGNRDKAFRAAAKGGVAGAVVFAGKWIVSQNKSGTNILGREIAAAGSSGVKNAAAGDGMLQFVTLIYGPLRFHVTTGKHFSVRPKLDIASSLVLWKASRADQLSFNRRRSFASGVPVFEVDSAKRTGGLGGSQEGGVVQFRSKIPSQIMASDVLEKVIGHELVHVVQYDFAFNSIVEPIEKLILDGIPGGSFVHRYIDLGLNVPLLSALNAIEPYKTRPWEREARTLSGR